MRSSRSLLLVSLLAGCSSEQASTPGPEEDAFVVPLDASSNDAARPDATADSAVNDTSIKDGAAADVALDAADAGSPKCATTFAFKPTGAVTSVRVAGEWNAFELAKADAMTADASGTYRATIALPPGLHAYKLAVESGGTTDWRLDPGQGRRKYVAGVENSAVKVADCRLPSFTVTSSLAARTAAGAGTYAASLVFRDGAEASGADGTGVVATLERDGVISTLSSPRITVAPNGDMTLALSGLADGKHRVVVRAKTKSGRTSEPLRLVFWIEPQAFSWKDAVVYMIVTDRYRDGTPSNNPAKTTGADPRGDWEGGDLEGIRQSIADGTLDKLGVRALWLTPFGTNPAGGFVAADNVHVVTGYHGYWPIKAREVDARIGGAAALSALVKEAHAHGIRILQDYVVNHVHKDHEYVSAHPDWFRDGCVCGTDNCDWTARALDCKFASYLPDIDHSVPAANAQFVDDAVWWLDTFDLDGLRVDAVKHVEEVSTRNLAAEVREAFEPAGTKYFLMGETAMGWNDCPDPCNDNEYGTISKYIGHGLDGQFDFVLYHAVSYSTFAYGDKGMLHADYWTKHGFAKWSADAIMTPYIGSHDTARFVTLADYRGNRGIPGNQWSNTAVAPTDAEPYRRMRVAMAWLLGLPGAPLVYYGDEYGQWGGADPNNRLMWRPESALSTEEAATLTFTRKLGTARKTIPALRRGTYVGLVGTTEDTLVFGRKVTAGDAAVVALTRASSAAALLVDVQGPLGFTPGTVLHDALGGPDVTVDSAGKIAITVPARSAVMLAR